MCASCRPDGRIPRNRARKYVLAGPRKANSLSCRSSLSYTYAAARTRGQSRISISKRRRPRLFAPPRKYTASAYKCAACSSRDAPSYLALEGLRWRCVVVACKRGRRASDVLQNYCLLAGSIKSFHNPVIIAHRRGASFARHEYINGLYIYTRTV